MAATKAGLVLKTVKKIIVQFCPFESNVRSTREFLAVIGSEKVRSTNMNCEIITLVKHDQSVPTIDITFLDGERLLMKGANLKADEMISALKSHCNLKNPHAGDK